MEAAKKQQDENRRKMEESNRKRAEDFKRQQEEIAKKKQEELQKRQEEMKKKQEETKATAAIRKVLQKFRFPQMGKLDALKQELAEELTANLENCGSQKAAVENEVKLAEESADAK